MRLPGYLLVTLLVGGVAERASAHHPGHDLNEAMGSKERFFEAVDKPAPPFTLEDAEGQPVSLEDLRGKVVVLHFIYTNCPDVCPLHAERIAEIQAMVNRTAMRTLVQFVTITTDPANDTPDVLRDYGPAHGLDPVNWVFLSSGSDRSEDTTRKLAERFGHKFTETEDGYQIHGVVTHVIDRDGHWQANFHGLKFEPANLVVYVNALTHPDTVGGLPEASWWGKLRNLF